MRVIPVLAWRLLRGSGRRGALTTGLSAIAVAIATALVLLTLGVTLGFTERANRESWLYPVETSDEPTVLMGVSTDYARGRHITVVDLAAIGDNPPAPPGLSRFPAPGEVWLSPELAALTRELPADELAGRYENERAGSSFAGELGSGALTYPEHLIAVIGRDADELRATHHVTLWRDPVASELTQISAFSGSAPDWALAYKALSAFAMALVVVPLFVLGSQAGRLTTAQRDRRLAAMRLVGATPGQVLGITTFETVLIGMAGAVIGAVAYIIALPFASQVSASGGTWYASDLWVGPLVLAATLIGAPLIVGASALLGLRNLIISPLGVARLERPRGVRIWRVILFALLLIVYAILAPAVRTRTGVAFASFLALLFLSLSIMGPFIVRLLGYGMTYLARGPGTLLAGRRIVDDPYAVWRNVGGITLTGFVAGFLTIIIPASDAVLHGSAMHMQIFAPEKQAQEIASRARHTLADYEIAAGVSVDTFPIEQSSTGETLRSIDVVLHDETQNPDQARTILTDISPGLRPASYEMFGWNSHVGLTDIRVASVLVLAVTLAVATASTAITGVTGVIDRRQAFGLLRLAGTPLSVLDGARLRETLTPFLLFGGGAVAAGMFCAAPLAVTAGVSAEDRTFMTLLIPVAVATAGLTLAEITSRITLRTATSDPTAYRQ